MVYSWSPAPSPGRAQATQHPEAPVAQLLYFPPGRSKTRIFRKGAGDAQISPLHHACLFPCHPMSFICSFTSPLPLQARTDRVRHALRGRSAKRGEAGWLHNPLVGLDIQVQLPESIHSQSTVP